MSELRDPASRASAGGEPASEIDIAEMSHQGVSAAGEGNLGLGGLPDITRMILDEFEVNRDRSWRSSISAHCSRTSPSSGHGWGSGRLNVDALSQLQLLALPHVREAQPDNDDWTRVLLPTVNGTTAGLQNTG